ncbi:MAG: hypothetical protein WDO17_28015 [Alphaproteobacteria bacterium]
MAFDQPSHYGNDNSCILDAIATTGLDRARGIVAVGMAGVNEVKQEKWPGVTAACDKRSSQAIGATRNQQARCREVTLQDPYARQHPPARRRGDQRFTCSKPR